ncbi:MAG TPA: hypothetical protein VHW23_29515, partial [Kofleriaceae bacterium]|nr:hypothetical protein [Kofleriaceae bacterium]
DILSFPQKLGDALAEAVCDALADSYSRTVSDIVTGLIASLATSQVIHEIGSSLASDPEVAGELDQLISIVAAAGAD